MTVLEQEPSRWGHGRLALFGTFLILSLVFFLVNFSTDYDLQTPLYLNTTKGADWREWKTVQRMYVFGDSWSDTGFAINGTKPSLENPIGNPAWPGHTSANGSNWVGQLTSVYNQSVIMTTNYAMSGAMIDPDDNFPTWPHLQHEVRDNFVAAHNEHGAADTLIAIWIGVNNILFNTPSEGYAKDFEIFTDLLDFLVRMGYDNFLLLNAPPLQRSPLSHKTDLDQQYAGRVDEWNSRLDDMFDDVGHRFDNTTMLLFDVNKLMGEIMDDPGRFPQTKHVKIVEESCGAYMLGTPSPDSHDAHCEYSADKYLWLNDFHPSAALHDAVAAKVAEVLSGGD